MILKKLLVLFVVLLVAGSSLNQAAAQEEPAEDSGVSFAYQGKVRVAGEPFTGQGQFKFSILDPSGQETLWSHDGTDPEVSSEPAGSVTLPVEDGTFSLIVGDVELGMESINATLFQSDKPLKLRVWFNDGQNGFQQMNPDYDIVNLALRALQTTTQDFTIYVNERTGNDRNNGLSRRWPKRTIQAAIDTLPERIRCNVTIDVAEGEYHESLKIFGISIEPEKSLVLQGDTSWDSTASSGLPKVRLTGISENNSPAKKRIGIASEESSGFEVRGFLVDNFTEAGIRLTEGRNRIESCLIEACGYGVQAQGGFFTLADTRTSSNTLDGLYVLRQCAAELEGLVATNNTGSGLRINGGSTVFVTGKGTYSQNGGQGIIVQHLSSIIFKNFPQVIANNGEYGIYLIHKSYCENEGVINFYGNGEENFFTLYGGSRTY